MEENNAFRLSLGRRIKDARIQARLTQEQLAEKVNLSRGTIARYEIGEIEPKLQNLALIAEQLHVSTDYLIGINNHVPQIESRISSKAASIIDELIQELRMPDGKERNK